MITALVLIADYVVFNVKLACTKSRAKRFSMLCAYERKLARQVK